MSHTLALDIGGTKIAYGLIEDSAPGDVLGFASLPTQAPGSTARKQVLAAVTAGAQEAAARGITIAAVGIGAPGVVRAPEGTVLRNGDTLPGWAGTDLRAIVAKVLPGVPVACHNDVRVWAYGEQRLGAGRAYPTGRVLYVSLGTGVGGAIVSDGALVTSPNATAGELSELICGDYAGKANRAESVISGPGMVTYYDRLTGKSADGFQEVLAELRRGGETATMIVTSHALGFGRMLGGLAFAMDFSAIVLGGGVVAASPEIVDGIRRGVAEAMPYGEVPVVTAEAATHAPLIGAAAFARDFAQ